MFAAHSLIDASPFPSQDLEAIRETGLAESIAEREVGLASLSAPITNPDGSVIAVLSVSGPAERLTPTPIEKWGPELYEAAQELTEALR